ncbi:hypothetical protein J7E88_14415 [Streptomyces sp. ISL-10]|uniref:hypothetical protein n=1 Tax=Streptomyces sp. ISL-10 TaxID=2819172 RepID=UPI001BE804BC|nr:hypothetical protein [Streptomyces sp. ISL-10]MBT2366468.1 hypothetical protein [Streptomyces sp. ISL-10]
MSRTPLSAFARREWGALHTAVRAELTVKRWRAVSLTLVSVALTAFFYVLQHRPRGLRLVHDIGFVRAEDPLWLALLRTPLSLFVPALDLPVWGALAQILLVFGIAELTLGRRRTLVIAYVSTLAGTTYARIGVAVGPDGAFGLPASDARIVDTGPSAAVVGLAVFICHRYRAWVTAGLVLLAMIVEVIVEPNLAGKEHLAAIGAVLVVCGADALLRRRGQSSRDGGRSGAPPIRS